jgi:hypothetical protein
LVGLSVKQASCFPKPFINLVEDIVVLIHDPAPSLRYFMCRNSSLVGGSFAGISTANLPLSQVHGKLAISVGVKRSG